MLNKENLSWKNCLMTIMSIVACFMVFCHIIYLFFPFTNALLFQNIHLAFCVLILCLAYAQATDKKYLRVFWIVFALICLAMLLFIHLDYERLHMWAGYPEGIDFIVGVSLAIVVAYLSFLNWGLVFPILAALAISYALWGHNLTGVLSHPELDVRLVVSNMAIGFEGIYGMMLNTSANMIFFFIIFGCVFEAVGITAFFREFGRFVGNKMRGGAGIGSIFSSSLLGMCTGGSIVNVALAGSFTLPLMRDAGFKPTIAGGIESTTSTGGALTPPVMGIAIFIMASFLNMTYAELVPAAIIPAFFYYLGLILGVVLVIKRDNIPFVQLEYNTKIIKLGAPVFIIPILVLSYLLFERYTPAFAATYALGALLIVAFIRKETRPSLRALIKGFTEAAQSIAALAVVLALIGIFIAMLNITNAGPKLSALIQIISGGSVVLSLFFTMLLCIILGCALPAPVAYMVVAIVVAPGLKDLGIPIVSTHLFCFYYAILSNITPPIAGSSMMASRMLNVSFMKTGWESFKFALPFFIVPYFVIFNPVMIMESQPFVQAFTAILMLFISCISVCFATWGYYRGHLSIVERFAFVAIASCAVLHSLHYSFYFGIVAVIGFIVLFAYRLFTGTSVSLFTKTNELNTLTEA